MREAPVTLKAGAGVVVDVCDDCGTVFLEYFDGEPAMLARALDGSMPRRKAALESSTAAKCPDCDIELELRPYLEEGPSVYRCGGCLAVVATRAQLLRLAQFRVAPDREAQASFLTKLLRLLSPD